MKITFVYVKIEQIKRKLNQSILNKGNMCAAVVYSSTSKKTTDLANEYTRTHEAPHRFLAYRDVPEAISKFVKGKKTLDFGAGTGASTTFLHSLGLDVTGVDVSPEMLEKARASFPEFKFCHVEDLTGSREFDLVFSSFVLLELSSLEEITSYLSKSFELLKEGGIFIGITASEELYQSVPPRKWMTFDTNFVENHSLRPGDITKVVLKEPKFVFHDYFWRKVDYLECFRKSGFEVLKVQAPLGSEEEPYLWEGELKNSPYSIFIARKPSIGSIFPSVV